MSLLVKIVDAALPDEPVHIYDIWDEPKFIRQLRLWVRDKKKGPRIYPVHGYATISGTPFTMFRCQNGHTTIGEPYALPDKHCMECDLTRWRRQVQDGGFTRREATVWEPADHGQALGYLRHELGESEETIARTREPLS